MERGVPPRFGTERLPPAIGGDQGARFERLYEWLHHMHSLHVFDALAYERPILPRKSGDLATTMDTLTLLWGLCTIVQLFAHQQRMRCIACPVEQAKITLTGSKLAKKDDMVRAAMTDLNWKVADDHQADAGACGIWAFEQLWPKKPASIATRVNTKRRLGPALPDDQQITNPQPEAFPRAASLSPKDVARPG